jgi:hypothetical protein
MKSEVRSQSGHSLAAPSGKSLTSMHDFPSIERIWDVGKKVVTHGFRFQVPTCNPGPESGLAISNALRSDRRQSVCTQLNPYVCSSSAMLVR